MEDKNLNGYDLSRAWFDFSFENPDKICPTHSAIYFFCIEYCNRLGWKNKFGLPTDATMEAIGVKSYKTYIKGLNDLVEWGFIEVFEWSRNQYTSNIIGLSNALVKNTKAQYKALDKALIMHSAKQETEQDQSIVALDNALVKNTEAFPEQVQSTSEANPEQVQLIASIDKQLNNETNKQLNQETNDALLAQSPPVESLKPDVSEKEKKGKEKSSGKKENGVKNELYHACITAYDKFIKSIIDSPAKIDNVQGQAMKSIIEYLKKASNDKSDEGVLNSWNFILDNWMYLDEFYKQKLKLTEINSNIVNLMAQIKDGKKNGNNKNKRSLASESSVNTGKSMGKFGRAAN